MAFVDDWKAARKEYDASYDWAQRNMIPLKKQIEAGEYFHEAVKAGKISDKKHMSKIKKYLKDFDALHVARDVDKLHHAYLELAFITKRPKIGLEPSLTDMEKLLLVGEQLVAAGLTDLEKWAKYKKIHTVSAKKFVKACGKLVDFTKDKSIPEKKKLRKKVDAIVNTLGLRNQAVLQYYDTLVREQA